MKSKFILIAVIVLVFTGITYKLVANKKAIDAQNILVDNSHIAIPVGAIQTKLVLPDNSLKHTGSLIPLKEADISAVGGGKLVAVNYELGDFVQKGAVLATVDSRMLELNLEAAQIARDQAKRDFERFEALYEGGAATEQNFQNIKLQYDNAENQIEQLKKQIADNHILAPISGQIILKLKEEGEFVGPGSVIGQMVQVDQLKVAIMVSEKDIYTIKKGDVVKVTTDVYPGEEFEGKVSFISHKGDAVHNYQVEITLQNNENHLLKAGTFAYIDFQRKAEEEVILIPKKALIESLDRPMVYVIQENRVLVKNLLLGRSYGDQVEVVQGLEENEQVVVSGLVNISEGTLVEVID